MRAERIRSWAWAHKWSSLVCTLFLFLLCITGLPLIFHDEIDALSGERQLVGTPSARAGKPIDTMVAHALDDYQHTAGKHGVPLFIGFSPDNPVITVTVGPRAAATSNDMRLFSYDRATGQAVGEVRDDGVMSLLLKLHTDMLLGLPGMLFLGLMGLIFIVAIVSGVVLYAPFMRRLEFGTLRRDRSARVRLLDEHNLLGVVTLGWAFAIGLTGAINAFADPLTSMWRQGELSQMVVDYRGQPPLEPSRYGSIDRAVAVAQATEPALKGSSWTLDQADIAASSCWGAAGRGHGNQHCLMGCWQLRKASKTRPPSQV